MSKSKYLHRSTSTNKRNLTTKMVNTMLHKSYMNSVLGSLKSIHQ